jgi:hypothetical protein
MDKLPASLRYNASKLMLRENNLYIRPGGSDNGTAHSIFRFKMPERSLVDLSSTQLIFDFVITGLSTTASNWRNAKLPAAHKLIKYCRTYVNGQIASGGQCNHYDILYHALVKATGSEDYCLSRLESQYQELIGPSDEVGSVNAAPAATTKSARYVHTDLMGLFRSGQQSIIDTSLWGNLEIEIAFNTPAAILKMYAGSGNDSSATSNVSFQVSNVHLRTNVITQISPIYNQILDIKLKENGSVIRLPFQNFITNVLSGDTANRIQVNSGCVDSVLFAPLGSAYDSTNSGTRGDIATIANCQYPDSRRYTFDTGRDLTNASDCSLNVSVGSEQYPRNPYSNALDLAPATTQSFWGESADSRNLLYQGLTSEAAAVQSYSRVNFLNKNFVYNQTFSNAKEGYASRVLAGLDTSNQSIDIIINQTNLIPASGFAFVAAMTTSMLVYDTQSQSVQVIL